MPDTSTPNAAASAERRRSSILVASASLFGNTASPLSAAFDRAAQHVIVRSGDIVCRQGDPGDALYIVTHGSLEVLSEDGETQRRARNRQPTR
jgi:CRP-like cAMP-binding protein